MRRALWLLLLLAACKEPKPPVRVAAASDLAIAFEQLRAPFEQASGQKLELIFGSSGKLSKQIVEGAPFDLFASASFEFTEEPITKGACDKASRAQYAEGRLVIDAQKDPPKSLEDLKDPRFKKIAIASPDHAPYGRAAKEALTKAGLWEALEPRIVYSESIQQTLQLSRSGNVEAALVAKSLALDGVPVDPTLYTPLAQYLVVCGRGKNAEGAKAFAKLVLGSEGARVLAAAGFELPAAEPR
jgi:molybdate transport system substrate-binding protein